MTTIKKLHADLKAAAEFTLTWYEGTLDEFEEKYGYWGAVDHPMARLRAALAAAEGKVE